MSTSFEQRFNNPEILGLIPLFALYLMTVGHRAI